MYFQTTHSFTSAVVCPMSFPSIDLCFLNVLGCAWLCFFLTVTAESIILSFLYK